MSMNPKCGACGITMTPSNSSIVPEYFLCDECTKGQGFKERRNANTTLEGIEILRNQLAAERQKREEAERQSRISEDIKTAEKKILLEEIAKRSALEVSNRALMEALKQCERVLRFAPPQTGIAHAIMGAQKALAQTPDEAKEESCSK